MGSTIAGILGGGGSVIPNIAGALQNNQTTAGQIQQAQHLQNILGGGNAISQIAQAVQSQTSNQYNQSPEFSNNSPGWTGNQTITTSDMSIPTEGMAQSNLGIEPLETVTNGGNTVVGGVPVTTVGGGFSPTTVNIAKGIYGDNFQKQRALRKPLIKLT